MSVGQYMDNEIAVIFPYIYVANLKMQVNWKLLYPNLEQIVCKFMIIFLK